MFSPTAIHDCSTDTSTGTNGHCVNIKQKRKTVKSTLADKYPLLLGNSSGGSEDERIREMPESPLTLQEAVDEICHPSSPPPDSPPLIDLTEN